MQIITDIFKTIFGYYFWIQITILVFTQAIGRILLEWVWPGLPHYLRRTFVGITLFFLLFNFVLLIWMMFMSAPIIILFKYVAVVCIWSIPLILDTYQADRFSVHVPQSEIHKSFIRDFDDPKRGAIEITGGTGILLWGIYNMGDLKHVENHAVFEGFNSKVNVLSITNKDNQLFYQLNDTYMIGFKLMDLFLKVDTNYADDLNKLETESMSGQNFVLTKITEISLDALGIKLSGKKSEDLMDAKMVRDVVEAEDPSNPKNCSLAKMVNNQLELLEIRYYTVAHVRIDRPINDPRWLAAKGKAVEAVLLNEAEKIRTEGQLKNAKLIGDTETIEKLTALLAANGTSESFYGLSGVTPIINVNKKK